MSGKSVSGLASTAWIVERKGPVLVATLDRFPARNALNFACWQELDALVESADSDAGVGALVITGGERIFSAGGDMKDVEGRGSGLMKDAARLKYLQGVLGHLSRLSVPSIAAVEGPAVGVAWGLALTCDFIVAGRDATFMAPFAERRLVPDGGLAWHLVRAVGRLRATDILLRRAKLSAEEAAGLGLVSEMVDTGTAVQRALAIGAAISAGSRDTTLLSLRALRRAEHGSHRDYLDAELDLAALNLHNPDVAAARLSFRKGKA